MNCNLKFPIICLFILSITLSGCIINDEKNINSEISTNSINLMNVSLTKHDLPSNFTLLYDNHTIEPKILENQTGNNISWNILERYDATYYNINSTDGVMQSLLKMDTKNNAQNLTFLSKENLLSFNYKEKPIEQIGDKSYLLFKSYTESNISYTYYTLLFSYDTIFVALGGSATDSSIFIDYAKTIEQRILDESTNHTTTDIR